MTVIALDEISRLSVAERIQLAQDIWDSVWSTPENLALSEAQRQELAGWNTIVEIQERMRLGMK